MEYIFSEGNIIIVVNYFIGLFDVLVLIKVLLIVCFDLKVVVNCMLMFIILMYLLLLFVDNFFGMSKKKEFVNI